MGRDTAVMISHTSELAAYPTDKSYVQVAIEAVLKAGLVPVEMGNIPAMDEEPAAYCRRAVLHCGIYLGIIGFRYGSLVRNNPTGISYTELEFRTATEAKMPRVVLMLHEDAKIPARLVDSDRSTVDEFRRRVRHSGIIVKYVETAEQLAEAALHALYEIRLNGLPGDNDAAPAAGHRMRIEDDVARHKPWMVFPLERMVERPQLGGPLLDALLSEPEGNSAPTVGLVGPGGFGKTTLAQWACHRGELRRRYPGGLVWATLGQDVHGVDLAERINDLSNVLGKRRPAISDPDAAGAEFGRLLDDRDPILLVVDDVWDEAQLRPFRYGGHSCTRLVTTRIPDVVPASARSIAVDAMSEGQARELLSDGLAGIAATDVRGLVAITGQWPVLLNIVNGALRRRVDRGQEVAAASGDVRRLLTESGPAALDPRHPVERSQAVARTVEASLSLLPPDDLDRYLDLAIFPEDVEIPLYALAVLWPGQRVDSLCEEFVRLGLAADYRLGVPGPRLVLHDVMRAYVQGRVDPRRSIAAHRRLATGAVELIAGGDGGAVQWWRMPAHAVYMWRYLPYHLHQAGEFEVLDGLVCDLKWIETKTTLFGSVLGSLADLALADCRSAAVLQRVLAASVHVLVPVDPPAALGASLAARLFGVPGLEAAVAEYQAGLPRPLLRPSLRPPDLPAADGAPEPAVGITACAFAPNGVVLATAATNGRITLRTVADLCEVSVITSYHAGIEDCAFSPDGNLFAAASGSGAVGVWNVADGAVHTMLVHPAGVTSCAFSPDSAVLATGCHDGIARFWAMSDGTLVRTFTGHEGRITDCDFSPDGTILATTAFDQMVRIWDLAAGEAVTILTGHSDRVWGCAFSPDGVLLASAGQDGTVRVWRVADGRCVAVVHGPSDWMRGCAFSPNGTLLAGAAGNGRVPVWRVGTYQELVNYRDHSDFVRGCVFSPDGALLASVGFDGKVRLRAVASGETDATFGGPGEQTNDCAISPSGTEVVVARNDQTARLLELRSGRELAVFAGHSDWVRRCALNSTATLLATCSNDHTVRLWDTVTATEIRVFDGHTDRVRYCAFSPDSRWIASAGVDGTARIWNVESGVEQAVLTGHDWVESCRFARDGTTLATSGFDGLIRLWDATDWSQRTTLTGHTDCVTGCTFSPDGSVLASTSDDRTVRIWDVADGIEKRVLHGHTGWVEDCEFAPNGAMVATVSADSTVRLWDADSGRCVCALRVGAPLIGLSWHPDGRRLSVSGEAGLYLLQLEQ
ncbi:NB-ARC domain-containing protein [Nocardia vinacea]|uniref:NB-ARC domain-containing protein n=1 Tax=Nocardia vinacea TaxID=96468 RepID=UPI0033EEE5C1